MITQICAKHIVSLRLHTKSQLRHYAQQGEDSSNAKSTPAKI